MLVNLTPRLAGQLHKPTSMNLLQAMILVGWNWSYGAAQESAEITQNQSAPTVAHLNQGINTILVPCERYDIPSQNYPTLVCLRTHSDSELRL